MHINTPIPTAYADPYIAHVYKNETNKTKTKYTARERKREKEMILLILG